MFDEIQRSTSPHLSQVAAARVFLARLTEVERSQQSFALETTLSSRNYAPKIRRWENMDVRRRFLRGRQLFFSRYINLSSPNTSTG